MTAKDTKATSIDADDEFKPTTANCAHKKTKTRSIVLPLGGYQTYYVCTDCNHQWQEILEGLPPPDKEF